MFEAEFWVAVAFVIFLAILGFFGAHRAIFNALDKRSSRIQSELDEARRLKEEAQKLLAEYQVKKDSAQSEADEILASAKAEAERMAEEAHARLEEFVVRRTQMAETKIAQAESQALADVRSAAAEAAVSAAQRILEQSATGNVADALIARGIEDVKTKLN